MKSSAGSCSSESSARRCGRRKDKASAERRDALERELNELASGRTG